MVSDVIGIILNIVQILLLIFAAGFAIDRLKKSRASVMLVFFIYGIVCWLLSDIYWLALDIMLPDKRIRFGVNEIAEVGVFLLFASLSNIVSKMVNKKSALLPQILSLAYSFSCVGLWIAWNGEIVKDIISGLAFTIIICSAVNAAYLTEALSRSKFWVFCVVSFTVVILEYVILGVPSAGKIIDIICYALMTVNILFMFTETYKAIKMQKREDSFERTAPAFILSVLYFIVGAGNMYMSSDTVYPFAYALCSLSIPLLVYTVINLSRLEKNSISENVEISEGEGS